MSEEKSYPQSFAKEQKRFCRVCGREITEDYTFCPACGSMINKGPEVSLVYAAPPTDWHTATVYAAPPIRDDRDMMAPVYAAPPIRDDRDMMAPVYAAPPVRKGLIQKLFGKKR